jgi:hypothetical protein
MGLNTSWTTDKTWHTFFKKIHSIFFLILRWCQIRSTPITLRPESCTSISLIALFFWDFLFIFMITLDACKIDHQP